MDSRRDKVLTTLFHVTNSLYRRVITFLSVHSIKALPLMNGVCKWFARNKSKDRRQTVRAVPINHRRRDGGRREEDWEKRKGREKRKEK